jgi:hypothetical protein
MKKAQRILRDLEANKRVMVAITLPADLKKRSKKYCEKRGYYLSYLIEKLLEAQLKQR